MFIHTSMAIFYPSRNHGVFYLLFLLLLILVSSMCVLGRPATFQQDFRVTWSDSHIKQIDQGRTIQLVLDQGSGKLYIILFYTCPNVKNYNILYYMEYNFNNSCYIILTINTQFI